MAALPRALLVSICAILLVAVLAHAAEPETASMVVGLVKCADCTRKNMKAEAVFKGLHVVLKCKNAKGEFETKAIAKVDKSGAFSVPLAADLLQLDGELKQDCFAQLHTASHQPCPGQEPSWIVRPSSDDNKKKNFVAVAGKMHYSSTECASAFLCDPFHKKHLLHKKPIVIPHVHKKPIMIPHVHKKPIVIPHPHFHKKPVPEYTPDAGTRVQAADARAHLQAAYAGRLAPVTDSDLPSSCGPEDPEPRDGRTLRCSRSSSPSSRRSPSSTPSSRSSLPARLRSRHRKTGELRHIVGWSASIRMQRCMAPYIFWSLDCSQALTGLQLIIKAFVLRVLVWM